MLKKILIIPTILIKIKTLRKNTERKTFWTNMFQNNIHAVDLTMPKRE